MVNYYPPYFVPFLVQYQYMRLTLSIVIGAICFVYVLKEIKRHEAIYPRRINDSPEKRVASALLQFQEKR